MISWFFSLFFFLTPHIFSFFPESDWFILNVHQIMSHSCLKYARTFPSQSKIWGLYCGLLVPFRCWHPAVPGLIPDHSLLTLLRLCWSSCWSSSQVRFTPSLRPVLWRMLPGCSSSHRYSLISLGHFTVIPFPFPTWFSFLISIYHCPTTSHICLLIVSSSLECGLGFLLVCPQLHLSHSSFQGIFV